MPALFIQIRNVPELVEKQGGAIGSLAHLIGPATVEQRVYDEMAKRFGGELAKQGVRADVSVVNTPPPAGKSSGEGRALLVGAGLGVGAVGVGWAAWHFLIKRFLGGKR